MADGDDREESDNQRDDANLPQVGHLHIGEPEESDNLEEGYWPDVLYLCETRHYIVLQTLKTGRLRS